MALPTDHDMPVVRVTEDPDHGVWWVELPAGRRMPVVDADSARIVVRSEAYGAAIEFVPAPTEGELRAQGGNR